MRVGWQCITQQDEEEVGEAVPLVDLVHHDVRHVLPVMQASSVRFRDRHLPQRLAPQHCTAFCDSFTILAWAAAPH